MDKALILMSALLTIVLSGCTTQKTYLYNPQASMAMNVAVASGMDQGLKDTDAPRGTLAGGEGVLAAGIASGAAGLSAPTGGLTNAQAGALNLASWLISPGLPSTKSGVVAWIPNRGQSAEEAQKEFGGILADAAARVYERIQVETKTSTRFFGKQQYSTEVQGIGSTNSKLCKKIDSKISCNIGFLTSIPVATKDTPSFIANKNNFIFENKIGFNTSIVIIPNQKNGMSEIEFMQNLSAELPDWVYLYFAPKSISDQSGSKIEYPFYINKGAKLLFIKPPAL